MSESPEETAKRIVEKSWGHKGAQAGLIKAVAAALKAENDAGLMRAIDILGCLRPYQWVLTAKAAIRAEIDKVKP